ncbi:MAG: hypothetical protein KDC98_22080 [Planctomycetes bacterium]|nr:hypothetical protein [Planctomycetota bacterium]
MSRIFNPRTAFVAALAFLALVYGVAAARFDWFPSSVLVPALDYAFWALQPADIHRLYSARHDFSGARSYDADGNIVEISDEDNAKDVTLVTTFFMTATGARPGVRIIDRRGEVLHEWFVDGDELAPPPRQDPMTPLDAIPNYAHGTYLFENGDILINIEYRGLVRLDARGEVIWKCDRRTHHSIHRDADGNFWVSVVSWADAPADLIAKYFGLWPPVNVDGALKISPDGEILEEHDFVAALCATANKSLMWTNGPNSAARKGDILHLNDVEPLPAAIADQYPLFDAGDLLVSMCHIDTVFVYDPKTRAIKWLQTGPFVRQHDPDFLGDGWISIFDNRADESPAGQFLGGSRLYAVQPHTGAEKVLYAGSTTGSGRRRPFYSSLGGKAQHLVNGHWMLIEPTAGRVFEVDAAGRIRWEWVHEQEQPNMICEVLEGTRYAIPRDRVLAWPRR